MPFAKLLVAALCFIGAVWLAVKLTASGGGSAPTVRTAGSKITAHFQAHHKVGVRQQLMITACERRGHPDAFSLSDDDLRNTLIGELENVLGLDIRVIQKADTRHIALLAIISMMTPLQRFLFATDPTGTGAPLAMAPMVVDPEKLRNAAIARLSENPEIGMKVQELQKLDTKDLHDIIDDALKIKLESPLGEDDDDSRDPLRLGLDTTPQRRTMIKVITTSKYEDELIAFAKGEGFISSSDSEAGGDEGTGDAMGGGAGTGGGAASSLKNAALHSSADSAAARKDAEAATKVGTGHPKVKSLVLQWQRAGRTRADILLLGRSGVGKSRLINDLVGMGTELTPEGTYVCVCVCVCVMTVKSTCCEGGG